MNNGEVLLASLGYKPIRQNHPAGVAALSLLAIAAAGYYAWLAWPRAAVSMAPQRASRPPVSSPASKPTQAPAPPPVVKPTGELPTSGSLPSVAPPPAPVAARVAGPVPSGPAVHTRPEEPKASSETEDFNAAMYHQRAGDFDTALLKYRAVLQKNEFNAQARNNLGLLYLEKGQLEDAVRELKRAVVIDPQYARARTNLGVVLMRQNRLDDATAEFSAALMQDPRDVDALVNLGLVAKAQGNLERAKELLLRALTIAPRNAWAHYNLAVVLDHSGEVARAMEHYRSFLENAGPDVSARAPDVRARLDALTRR